MTWRGKRRKRVALGLDLKAVDGLPENRKVGALVGAGHPELVKRVGGARPTQQVRP